MGVPGFCLSSVQVFNGIYFSRALGRVVDLNSFKYYAANQGNMLPDKVRDKDDTKESIRLLRNFEFCSF